MAKQRSIDFGAVDLTVGSLRHSKKQNDLYSATQMYPGVIDVTTSTLPLTEQDNGKMIYLDRAAGCVVTLPPAVPGTYFKFIVGVSVTSNTYKIITNAATQFISGLLVSVDTDSSNALAYGQVGNGSTHVAITMNGTTTGGLIYTNFEIYCLTSTLWVVNGFNFGSGVVATPFATS